MWFLIKGFNTINLVSCSYKDSFKTSVSPIKIKVNESTAWEERVHSDLTHSTGEKTTAKPATLRGGTDLCVRYLHNFFLFTCRFFFNLIQESFSLIKPSTYMSNIPVKFFQPVLMVLERNKTLIQSYEIFKTIHLWRFKSPSKS